IEVLDQRTFLLPWMAKEGVLTARSPSDAEWTEIRHGFSLARHLASYGIGQTVVRSLGLTVAVEADEGTDATIRRAARLAGPGVRVVKAVGSAQDYCSDGPTVGLATLEAMMEGGCTALAMEGGRMLLVDREEAIRLADAHGIAVVGAEEFV